MIGYHKQYSKIFLRESEGGYNVIGVFADTSEDHIVSIVMREDGFVDRIFAVSFSLLKFESSAKITVHNAMQLVFESKIEEMCNELNNMKLLAAIRGTYDQLLRLLPDEKKDYTITTDTCSPFIQLEFMIWNGKSYEPTYLIDVEDEYMILCPGISKFSSNKGAYKVKAITIAVNRTKVHWKEIY